MSTEAIRGVIKDDAGDFSSSSNGATIALVGRLLLSALFLISGIGKLAAPAATIGYISLAGLPFPQVAYALAVLVEIVGSVALIAGYRTRIAAGALVALCLVTAFAFHSNFADQNQFVHFFKNIAAAGGLMQIVAFGAGRFSLDARRR